METLIKNKIFLLNTLSTDASIVLQYVLIDNIITSREYNNLNQPKYAEEQTIINLLDNVMSKGDEACHKFLKLLQREDLQETFPQLKKLFTPDETSQKKVRPATASDEIHEYKMSSEPRGVCLIISNMTFDSPLRYRHGSDKDEESLKEVFEWLGFTVEVHRNQTAEEMKAILKTHGQKHHEGDSFVCCILTHGTTDGVYGTDGGIVTGKDIFSLFSGTSCPSLINKPKVFLIQTCLGKLYQLVPVKPGQEQTLQTYVEIRIPVDEDFLVVQLPDEPFVSLSIQLLCHHLKRYCPEGKDIDFILQRSSQFQPDTQISTLNTMRKRLVFHVPKYEFLKTRKDSSDTSSVMETLIKNKIFLLNTLSTDASIVLQYVLKDNIITSREYNNLNQPKYTQEQTIINLLDNVMSKGDEACHKFLKLLQREDLQETFPQLKKLFTPDETSQKKVRPATASDEIHEYKMSSEPRGVCLIISNMTFDSPLRYRHGSDKDEESIKRVFEWLGFTVEVHRNQTAEEMKAILKTHGQKHHEGDSFVCCILTHGTTDGVYGTDGGIVTGKDIFSLFSGTSCPSLLNKPKVFLIKACLGKLHQQAFKPGQEQTLQTYDKIGIPVDEDFLVVQLPDEPYYTWGNPMGSSSIQLLCHHLKRYCPEGEDIDFILQRSSLFKPDTQISTLNTMRKRLVFHVPKYEFLKTRKDSSDTSSGAEFVDKHRQQLIQRISSVMEIADSLRSKGMISGEIYGAVRVAATSQEQMRILYGFLKSGGRAVKEEFYNILKEKHRFLVDDLESGSSIECSSKSIETTSDKLEGARATSTQNPYTIHHSADTEVFIPELVKDHHEERNSDAYRFLCSGAGQFQCKYTNLVFEMKEKGEVLYSIVSWDSRQLDGVGQMQPAGPLYNINCSEGSICNFHLPHCEIDPDKNQTELAVAHFCDGNMEIVEPLKVTDTHVIIDIKNLSDFGLLKKKKVKEDPIRAQVLLFYTGVDEGNKVHMHLLPRNVDVREVQKKFQQYKYIVTSSNCDLTPRKKYRPCCETYKHQPKTGTFYWDYGPNYHPTFEVLLKDEVEELTLGLLDEHDQEMWESRQVFLTDKNQTELAVAHTCDGNMGIVQPLKNLSLFGRLKKKLFKEDLIRAQVLLFYTGMDKWNKVHMHLLPRNVPVEKVQKKFQQYKYIVTSSNCELTPHKKYRPCCETYKHQPKTEAFDCEYGPNYHPTFEVLVNAEIKELTLGLMDKHDQEVWESRQVFLTGYKREAVLPNMATTAVETVHNNKVFLIDTLTDASIVLQHVQNDNIITTRDYNNLNQPNHTHEQIIIKLLDNVTNKGNDACHKFLRLLEKKELQETFPRLKELFTPDHTSHDQTSHDQTSHDQTSHDQTSHDPESPAKATEG
ncbi:uncharacterized protein LOC113524415 isoform X2 [Pangasianodon hypophthalmus]|uniref:uncharacterized protein LOC113524415 isoform X2 n=1 Tax=Pangasianodon hypophthalmus TaxID=310915 RepID=UPI00230732CC|nr:uncharacterized protein LOC113524415 isoform X2 [Pangasianodon hypophthalmus]